MKQIANSTKINGTQAVENMADMCDISFLKVIYIIFIFILILR